MTWMPRILLDSGRMRREQLRGQRWKVAASKFKGIKMIAGLDKGLPKIITGSQMTKVKGRQKYQVTGNPSAKVKVRFAKTAKLRVAPARTPLPRSRVC